MTTLAELLDSVADPTQPLLTYYDLTSGERVELSATTTANWVAKTANFLIDDLDAEIGTRIRLDAPSHWQTNVWILAAWKAGCILTDRDADIAVVGPERRTAGTESFRVALSMRPFAARFAEPPAEHIDYNAEVLGHSDYFMSMDPVAATLPAVHFGGTISTHRDVIDRTVPNANRQLTLPLDRLSEIGLLVSTILGGGSLVQVRGGTAEQHDSIASSEHASR